MDMKLFNGSIAVAAIVFVLVAPSAHAAATTPPDQPVLVDTSSSAGSVVASSSSSATYSASKAFDGNWGDNAGRWLAYTNPENDYGSGVHGESPMYLVYKFNNPTKVNVLRLRIRNENEWDKRSPKAWTFLGSNDGSTWTQLDARSGVAWASGDVTKTFSFENRTAYEYYKFSCSEILGENNYMQIYEIQFLCDTGIVLTDLTNPDGTVTTTTAGDWVRPAKNAFDNGTKHNNDDRSIHSGRTVDWIYTFGEPTKVNAYKVYAPGTGSYFYDKRMPKTWTFQAKNAADSTWNTLDTQSSETEWSALESRYYEFQNNTAYDSYRFAVTANQSGSDDYIQIDELEFFYVNRGAPRLGETSLVRTGAQAYSLTATEDTNAADLSYILDDGETVSTNETQSVAESGSATWSISGLTADKTYQVSVLAENASGLDETVAGTLYAGELTLGATTDANENGLVAGTVAVSRENGDPWPLVVNYTISSSVSGAAEGTTWSAPTAATIPAGETTGYLLVKPILDNGIKEDITITVTLAAGNYEMPAITSTTLGLINLTVPSGYNTWIATADGLASVGSNWSEGHKPTSSENVLFDGRFSTFDCEWDSAASATVASWTQTADYTGTVQIDTTYDSTFPALNITGNVEILGGKWTHRINEANDGQKYHLKAIVGGDFTLASGCTITAEMKGYWAQKYPDGSTYSAHAASGDGFDKIYGNVYRPADLGAGSSSSGSASDNMSGGGAVWLEVGGAATLNGTVNVRGRQFGEWNGGSNTACGSFYLKAKSCTGSGIVLANQATPGNFNGNRGSGGRVAIELTEATTLGLPVANVKINGVNAGSSGGGGGTFYVKTADPAKPNGTLYLDDTRTKSYGSRWHNPQAITAIPAGETWTFDAIVISNYGMLAVPVGTTLNLPNGPMSVSATSTRQGGIRYDGGTINWGSAPYEFASNWIFQANAPYTFDGDVVVHSGGAIGCMQYRGNSDFSNFTKCDVTVNGNLTVESGGYLYANGAGPDMEINRDTVSFHGGQSAGAEGNKAYDSVFSPRLPGYGTANGDQATSAPGGGLLLLSVSGAFVNNGTVTANGASADSAGASGGSISITAGTLSGAGAFKADSASGSNGSGGGGRIAVRLTNGDFATGAETNFFARGATVVKDNASSGKSSSAGTVYLQGKSNAEKGGTIYVRNDKNALNTNTYTPIPAGVTKGGIAPDAAIDFKSASLVVGDCARVKLFDSFKMCALGMESGTSLDLNGKTLTVKSAKLGGTKLSIGTYAAGDEAVAGYVTDSVGGGELVVTGGGFFLFVR